MTDERLIAMEVAVAAIAAWAWLLAALYWLLRRTRPELRVGRQLALAGILRVGALIGVSTLGVADTLRGGDEVGFLVRAHDVAAGATGAPSLAALFADKLYLWVLAIQIKAFDATELSLRISECGIVVLGLLLIIAAVHDLAGPRAAAFAGWLLAIEPSSIFFSGLLHKESLTTLAGGLVALGAAQMWKHLGVRPLLLMAGGCLIALATRPYAGWFLITASLVIALHASMLQRGSARGRSLTLLAGGAVFIAAVAPAVLQASSDQSLKKNLQGSQDANATDNSNLSLERVDYSSRGGIAVNLPRRMLDVSLRPYPWQIGNVSQRLGLLGTAMAYSVIALLIGAARKRGAIMQRAGPFLYLTLLLLVAYSLSSGNAGTAFRYRTHVVAMAIAAVAVLRKRPDPQAALSPETAAAGSIEPPIAPRSPLGAEPWKEPLTT